jgi:hypothetical protein
MPGWCPVAATAAAISTTCNATLNVALGLSGCDLAYSVSHRRIMGPPAQVSFLPPVATPYVRPGGAGK